MLKQYPLGNHLVLEARHDVERQCVLVQFTHYGVKIPVPSGIQVFIKDMIYKTDWIILLPDEDTFRVLCNESMKIMYMGDIVFEATSTHIHQLTL